MLSKSQYGRSFLEHIDAHERVYIERLAEAVAIPSISGDETKWVLITVSSENLYLSSFPHFSSEPKFKFDLCIYSLKTRRGAPHGGLGRGLDSKARWHDRKA